MRLAPLCASLAIMAAVVGACGRSIFPSADSSPTATPTATPVIGAFLYSTNLGSGTVSQFKRNRSSGVLTANGSAAAGNTGSNAGPFGIAAYGNFVYVANTVDGVHQYKINQSSGKLSAIGGNGGLVSAGSGSQWVAISSGGKGVFAYVMNYSEGSISQYVVQSDGTLKANGKTTNASMVNPYAAVATSSFLYVTDKSSGLVFSFAINSDGTLATPSATSTTAIGTPSPGPIVIDPSGQFVYVGDLVGDFVSQLNVITTGTGGLQLINTYAGPASSSPIAGLAIAEPSSASGNFFLYASNQLPGTLSLYVGASSNGVLSTPPTAATGLLGPAGIAIDGAGSFLYVANSTGNSLTQFSISGTNGALSNPSTLNAGTTPEYIAIP